MTKKADFTEEEWKRIVSAPPMVGVVVAAASLSGHFGLMKEMLAVGMAMGEIAERGSDNALLAALVENVKQRATMPEVPENLMGAPMLAKERALSHLSDVAQILYRKAPDAEAEKFKRWLVSLAERVPKRPRSEGSWVLAVNS